MNNMYDILNKMNLLEGKSFKPDFPDIDNDGNRTEPIAKAARDQKNMREHDGRDDEPEETDDDGRTMADRARRDGRGGDDEPEETDDDGRTMADRARRDGRGGDDEPKTAAQEVDEASYSAKAARAGKDIGKPGKTFAKIAKSAGERYGSKERGEKVAGAVLAKLRAKESIDEADMEEGNEFSGELAKARATGAKEFKVDGKSYKVTKEEDEKMMNEDVIEEGFVEFMDRKAAYRSIGADVEGKAEDYVVTYKDGTRKRYQETERGRRVTTLEPVERPDETDDEGNVVKRGRGRPKGTGRKIGTRGVTDVRVKKKKVAEATGNLGSIIRANQRDVDAFMRSGDLSDSLYDVLFDYYFDEMPYGTAKARTGDPYEWISDRFYADMGGGVSEGQKLDRFMRKYVPGSAKRQIDDKIKDELFTQMIVRDGDPTDPQNQKEINQTQRNIRRLTRVGKKDMAEDSTQQRKIVKKAGKPVGEVGIDHDAPSGRSGRYYMKHYASGTDLGGYDSFEEAMDELRYAIKQTVAEDYDKDEYDEEGEMAKSQARTIEDAAQELQDILDDDENLPEWVQKKITLAKEYIDSARDYMKANPDEEEVDVEVDDEELVAEKAVSKAQRAAAGIAYAAKKGDIPKSELRGASKEMAKMDTKELKKFAKTKEKGLPEKKKEESVEETTVAGSVATAPAEPSKGKKGMVFGKGVYESQIAESYNKKLDAVLTEGMTINASVGEDGRKSLTVSATDDDAEQLAAILKMAGVGSGYKSACPSCGGMHEGTCQMDEDLANAPDEEYADTDTMVNTLSGGLNARKTTGQTTGAPFNKDPARMGIHRQEQVDEAQEKRLFDLYKQFKG